MKKIFLIALLGTSVLHSLNLQPEIFTEKQPTFKDKVKEATLIATYLAVTIGLGSLCFITAHDIATGVNSPSHRLIKLVGGLSCLTFTGYTLFEANKDIQKIKSSYMNARAKGFAFCANVLLAGGTVLIMGLPGLIATTSGIIDVIRK